jgi:hypothetical protein
VGCFYSCLLYPECWFVCDLSPWMDMPLANSLNWWVSHPVCPVSCILLTLVACTLSIRYAPMMAVMLMLCLVVPSETLVV